MSKPFAAYVDYELSILVLKNFFLFGNWKLFKNDEKCFLFHLKLSSFSRYLNFCLNFLII